MADFMTSNDMQQNLALISSLPQFDGNWMQLRVHYLLDLVTAHKSNQQIVFNFTELDKFIDLLFKNNLTLDFELMGNPSQHFTDFSTKSQLLLWQNLITTMINRYTVNYGTDWISKWRFETWNEPDQKNSFENINFTIASFIDYYHASLTAIQKSLIGGAQFEFGGPGEICLPIKSQSFCWRLIDELMKSNHSFLSFHEKGKHNDIATIIENEAELIKELTARFPNRTVKFYNNEADPIAIWSEPRQWQADVTYSGLQVKLIAMHIDKYFRLAGFNPVASHVDFQLLSNDNAFLSFFPNQFTQRTLLARFQINNTLDKHVQMIKKPVFASTMMLNLLGNHLIRHTINGSRETINVIATKTQFNSYFVIVVNCERYLNQTEGPSELIKVVINTTPAESRRRYQLMMLDNNHSNPYRLWLKSGSPSFPSSKLFRQLRMHEQPRLVGPEDVTTTRFELQFKLRRPAVALLLLCSEDEPKPEQVTNVRAIRVNNNQVSLTWNSSNSR